MSQSPDLSAPPISTVGFEVQGRDYKSLFQRQSNDLVWYDRTHLLEKPKTLIEVLGQFWIFAVLPPGQSVSTFRHGKKFAVPGGSAGFFPPFSIVRWHLNPGTLKFRAYMSRAPIPSHLPKDPFWFKWVEPNLPTSTPEIFSIIENSGDRTFSGFEESVSAVAEKTKRLIDATFRTELTLAEIGNQLKYSHAVMTRAFKKCYGLAPVKYRNQMRTIDAMVEMALSGQEVAKSAKQVGFNDLSHFNYTFRRLINAVPSQFRAIKKNKGIPS